jgi:AAA15 family ATPase/GTPase
MFLRSLTIKNYRSLENVKLPDLGRFSVLIGRTNSGKSSVFGALEFLSSLLFPRPSLSHDPNRVLSPVWAMGPGLRGFLVDA